MAKIGSNMRKLPKGLPWPPPPCNKNALTAFSNMDDRCYQHTAPKGGASNPFCTAENTARVSQHLAILCRSNTGVLWRVMFGGSQANYTLSDSEREISTSSGA